MIDLFDLWEKFCGENNTHQNGHVRPNRNFVNWVNAISQELFEEKFKTGWQKSQKTSDDIGLPFLRSEVVAVVPGSSFDVIPFPDTYGHFSSCRFFRRKSNVEEVVKVEIPKCGCPDDDSHDDGNFYYTNVDEELEEVSIELIPNNKWGAITGHVFKKPTYEKPKITQFNEGFKLAPKGKIAYVVLDFLQRPKNASFEYTVGANDEIVYDANISIKLEWTKSVETEFLTRLSRKYGKFTKQADIYQAASAEITAGQ